MPETPWSKFRLSDDYLALLDELAASNGGNRSAALREAILYWHRLVAEAGRQNAEDLAADDWTRLAHLNDPDPLPPDVEMGDEPIAVDWSARLAHEIVGMWEGRPVVLDLHRQERDACRELARRIAGWGPVRGYALFAALRYFWRHQDAGVGGGEWWAPEVWMTPTARD